MLSSVAVCGVLLIWIACAASSTDDLSQARPSPAVAAGVDEGAWGGAEAAETAVATALLHLAQQQEAEAVPRRGLKISDKTCLVVCDTSALIMAKPELSGKVHTRECQGERHMASCCICLDQGFDHAKAVARRDRYNGPGSEPQPAFMHICIPTTPRILDGKDIDFLNIMLKSLEEQVLDQHSTGHDFSGVNLMVFNTRPGKHPVFETNRAGFEGHKFIAFKEIAEPFVDPTDFEPDNMNNPNDVPGGEVRHQTFDYIQMLRECAAGGGAPEHPDSFVVILEDDFLPCPFAIDEMHRVLQNVAGCSPKGYSSISFSKGMNAIAIPLSKIQRFTEYLEAKITVLPPDLLIYSAWDPGATDVHYSNDLFTHLGWFSSFEFRNQMNFAKYNNIRGAHEKCYSKRQRYAGHMQRSIGTSPLSAALYANPRSGRSDMGQCPRFRTAFEWHRPAPVAGPGNEHTQQARYDHWLALAKQQLPGVAQNNRRWLALANAVLTPKATAAVMTSNASEASQQAEASQPPLQQGQAPFPPPLAQSGEDVEVTRPPQPSPPPPLPQWEGGGATSELRGARAPGSEEVVGQGRRGPDNDSDRPNGRSRRLRA